jgi:hypothetical protein
MTKSRLRFLAFLILTTLCLHCLFWYLYVAIFSADSIQRKKAALKKIPQNHGASVWIMGDSHPMLGLNPALIGHAFNWAGTSEYYFLTRLKIKKALSDAHVEKPYALLLPLDLHSFSAKGNRLLLQHELDDYFWQKHLNYNEITSRKLPEIFLRWWISARFFPYAGQFYQPLASMKGMKYKIQPDGFVPDETNFGKLTRSERISAARSRYQAHFGNSIETDSLQINALAEIMQLCSTHNIHLFLIAFPLSDEYLKEAEADSRIKQVQRLQQNFIRKNTFLNYQHVFRNRPELFSDPDHLNTRGAEMLSRMLKTQLEKLRKKPASEP